MDWYQFLSADTAKWVTLAVFIVTFAFILYRRFNIAYVALIAAGTVILLGIVNPADALLEGINWDVLAIYWGFAILAFALRESQIPAWIANEVLARTSKERYALLFLCAIAMVLSCFIANPEVVLILAPLAFAMADKMNGDIFTYMIALAISSNVVTTVTMVADPPALIMAGETGMSFFEFYWFQNKLSLGTISVVGILAALLVLYWQFRRMNKKVEIERENVQVTYGPLALFVISVAALAFIPWDSLGMWNHRGLVGLVLGGLCLMFARRQAVAWLREFDWKSIFFLIGIFMLIYSVNSVGLLEDFARLLLDTGISSPTIYLAILVWVSVLLSSFIDNVPYTVIMLPVCAYLAQSLGVSPFPFYFGVLIGTGMGGNLTPVGATANVLACGMLEKRNCSIDLGKYIKIAWPFTAAAVLASHILLQIIWL